MLGDSKIEIPKKVIDTLKGWNQQKDTIGPNYDKRMTFALLLVCVTGEDLAEYKVNNDVRNLIKGKSYNYNYNVEIKIQLKYSDFIINCNINCYYRFLESSSWASTGSFERS